jgi:hypothetical protein
MWPLGADSQDLDGFKYLVVNTRGQVFEVAAEAWREDEAKTGWHASAGPACGEALLQVPLKSDPLARADLLRSDLEALLKLGVELLQHVVKVGGPHEDGGRLAVLGDEETGLFCATCSRREPS